MSFEPVFNKDSRILILGTYPSPVSLISGFYYGHPQNRFWRLIAEILNSEMPQTIEEKKQLLITNSIALWDVLESCDIVGAADSTIRNPVPNDIAGLVKECNIELIFTNGAMAAKLYQSFWLNKIDIQCKQLPSTSPANAGFSMDRLLEKWEYISKYLREQQIMHE